SWVGRKARTCGSIFASHPTLLVCAAMQRKSCSSHPTSSSPTATRLPHNSGKVNRGIPTVFVQVSDPVGGGFVDNMAHPGGNMTGFTNRGRDRRQVGRAPEGDCPLRRADPVSSITRRLQPTL